MSIDQTTVRKVASLSRIRITDEEAARYEGELNKILGFVEQLSELNTDDTEPLTSVAEMTARLRKDEISDGGYVEDVLKNAPDADHGFFLVPKVVE